MTTIKDYALGFYDGPHATPKESSEGPIFLGIKNVTPDGRLDFSEIRHVSHAEFPRWTKRVKPQKDDIVFTYEATLHRYGIIPEGFHGCLGRRMALIRPDTSKVFPRFLHYYCLSHAWRREAEASVLSGATVDRIPLTKVPDFKVEFPELATQERIAGVLSAYDDLIENNRRRIALLEQAARLLYREWFVHFRFPGYETAKFINGLPEGWSIQELLQVADFHLGKMLDQKKNKGTMLPYLANKNVRWGEFDYADLREMRFEDRELERFSVKDGDIIMCEGGEPGRCAIWRDEVPNMMYQKALHRIRPNAGIGPNFLFHELTHRAKGGYLSGLFTGATIKHLPKEKLALAKVCIPTGGLLLEFEKIAEPIGKQISELYKLNGRLAKARDLLLPRLMDGRLAIPE